MKKTNAQEIKKLAKEAAALLDKIESMKALYGQLDEITMKLVKSAGGAKALKANGIIIVNNFSDKNVVFRPAAVRLLELRKVG